MATRWLESNEGRLAYSDEGRGPLVICVPGIGDLRQEYRYLTPRLLQAGFRVASLDLRGHGESSTGWTDLSAEAIGGDILALLHHLGAKQALVIGTSMAAGAAVWAATEEPGAVSGLVLIGPFVRDIGPDWQRSVLQVLFRILLARPWGISFWMRFWSSLYPTAKPADFASYAAELRKNLSEPGRLESLTHMMLGKSRRAIEARLAKVGVPVLVVMGTKDSDFGHPAQEAELIAGRAHGRVAMVEGAGHYPHVEFPDEAGRVIVTFAQQATKQEANGAA
jgi:pimeloyl-ACP methyl ester carboxylesterase